MPQPEDFQKKAREAVAFTVNKNLDKFADGLKEVFSPGYVTESDFYVVWFAKTLQNWKALISTDLVNGYYFEVTYNGDRLETYVDTYTKESNLCLDDAILNHHIHLLND